MTEKVFKRGPGNVTKPPERFPVETVDASPPATRQPPCNVRCQLDEPRRSGLPGLPCKQIIPSARP